MAQTTDRSQSFGFRHGCIKVLKQCCRTSVSLPLLFSLLASFSGRCCLCGGENELEVSDICLVGLVTALERKSHSFSKCSTRLQLIFKGLTWATCPSTNFCGQENEICYFIRLGSHDPPLEPGRVWLVLLRAQSVGAKEEGGEIVLQGQSGSHSEGRMDDG